MASITLVRLEARRRALASACADIRQRGDASDKWEVIERGLDACADAGEVPELPRGLTEAGGGIFVHEDTEGFGHTQRPAAETMFERFLVGKQ